MIIESYNFQCDLLIFQTRKSADEERLHLLPAPFPTFEHLIDPHNM